MATPGLVFRIGGVLDPSYGGALVQSVTAARAASKQIETAQNNLRNKLSHPSNQIYAGQSFSILQQAEALERKKTAILINANAERNAIEEKYQAYRMRNAAAWLAVGQTSFAQSKENPAIIADRARTLVAAEEAAKRVAIERAAQLALLRAVAEGGTANALGHGGGGGGGISGVVRESLVILREIGRGNMTRVPGSLLLLLQYTGMLNLLMKTEKTEALLAAAAQEKLAQSTARAAMAAAAKTRAAKIAAGIDVRSDELKTAEAESVDAVTAAQTKRAAAERMAAGSTTLSKDAALANVEACEAEETAAVKVGMAQTLAAKESAAAAATIKASAATTAAAMALMVLPIVLLVAILVEAYMIYKELAMVINRAGEAEKEAAEYTREHTIALWEETEAMEKLKDASLKTTEALNKMNEAKDRSVELAHEAVEAANAEADAQSKLYDAATKGKLLDIEIAEKKGLITHQQAIQQKAAVEGQAVADKAAMEQSKLDNAAKILSEQAAKAAVEKTEAQTAAQAASDKINKSPEGLKRAEALAAAEKGLAADKTQAAEKAKKLEEAKQRGWLAKTFSGVFTQGSEIAGLKDEADAAANAAASSEIRVASLKRFMSPDEVAASEAQTKAGQKSSDADELADQARIAGIAAARNAKNSPAQVAAEQADITKQSELDSLDDPKIEKNESVVDKMRRMKAEIKAEQDQLAAAQKKDSGVSVDEQAALKKDLAGKEKALSELTSPDEKEKHRGSSDAFGLTDRQRAGAQIGGPAIALLDVNVRMEKHLANIEKNTSRTSGSKKSPWGGHK